MVIGDAPTARLAASEVSKMARHVRFAAGNCELLESSKLEYYNEYYQQLEL
jgi:hypothetical protein